jgi:hypothetical protein
MPSCLAVDGILDILPTGLFNLCKDTNFACGHYKLSRAYPKYFMRTLIQCRDKKISQRDRLFFINGAAHTQIFMVERRSAAQKLTRGAHSPEFAPNGLISPRVKQPNVAHAYAHAHTNTRTAW